MTLSFALTITIFSTIIVLSMVIIPVMIIDMPFPLRWIIIAVVRIASIISLVLWVAVVVTPVSTVFINSCPAILINTYVYIIIPKAKLLGRNKISLSTYAENTIRDNLVNL